jgi:hypothetical protein
MNFAEFPIALLTDRVPRGQKSIRFEDQIYDERRKKTITRRRVIEGSAEYGLPTATDDAVVLGLIQLTKLRGDFARREVEFTRLELIRMLGWPDEGRSYDRIKLSLQRISNVTYNYDNAWWDVRQGAWTTKIFHIIDTVEINDSRASDGRDGRKGPFASRIVWNEVVFDSFQAGFLRNIDFRLCMRLEHPTALRMYRFLGKRFHRDPDCTFDLRQFACRHIGIGGNYEGGTQIARKLRPAIAELEEAGFLEPLGEHERFLRKGREWSVRFVRKAPDAPPGPPDAGPAAGPGPSPLVEGLVGRGVTRATAEELVRRRAAEAIASKIDVLDWLLERRDRRVARNPAGYLVESIKNDYAPPKGFVAGDERRRRREAEEAEDLRAAEGRRRRREQDAAEKAEREAIAAYWEGLTPAQRAELEAASIARANPETLALEAGPFREMGRRIRREAYIRQRLRDIAPREG